MSAAQQEGSSGVHIPLLTLVLVAACTGALGYDLQRTRGLVDHVEQELAEAIEYFESHPYLEPPAALAERLGTVAIRQQRRRFEEHEQRRGAPPIPEGIQRRRQQNLDEMVAKSLAGFASRPVQRYGLLASERRPETLFTHVLFHSGWVHLVGNAFFLVVLGFHLESAWGVVLYALFLIGAAPVTGSVFAAMNPEEESLFIGTSSIVAALLGAYAVRFANTWREGVWVFLLVMGALWLVLPGWLGADWSLTGGLEPGPLRFGTPGVSWSAYAAGFGYGAVLAICFRLFRFEEAIVAPSRDARQQRVSKPLLEQAAQAQEEGRHQKAYRLLERALEEDPDDFDAAVAMWDVANALDRPMDAAHAMLQVIRGELRRREYDTAVGHWLELDAAGFSADADVSLLIKIATQLRNRDQPAAALSAMRRALEMAGDSTVVASRVAREARELDAGTAEQAAWKALGSVELDYDERQALEALLGEIYRERGFEHSVQPRVRPAPPVEAPEDPGPSEAAPPEEPEPRSERPSPIDLSLASRSLDARVVRPIAMEGNGIRIETDDGDKRIVPFEKIEAIAVAAVGGLAPKPVIVVDLVLNWMTPVNEPLRVVRLRGDRFDPRRLVPQQDSPLAALRAALERLLRLSDATPLPDQPAVVGRPFAAFDSLPEYERDVLMIEDASRADPV